MRFKTSKNVSMIRSGLFNWFIKTDDYDHSEYYILSLYKYDMPNIYLRYCDNKLFINKSDTTIVFKIPFNQTTPLIQSMIDGDDMMIYNIHKEIL